MAGFNSHRWSLKGKTALVTGGTKGIGYAIVEELAGLGATIHTCARNQELVDERFCEWKNRGLNSMYTAASVTLRISTEYALEDLSSMMSTNVESPYHLCQLSYPLLKASGNGSITCVRCLHCRFKSSTTIYAVIQISKNLACEWAKDLSAQTR